MPVKRVIVAPVAIVQKTSSCSEEVEGRFALVVCPVESVGRGLGPSLFRLQRGKQRKPLRQVVVSQAARALLDVGFEMKDGVAVLRVPGAGDLREVLHDGVPLAQGESGEQLPFETLVERQVTSDRNGGREVRR